MAISLFNKIKIRVVKYLRRYHIQICLLHFIKIQHSKLLFGKTNFECLA